MNQVKDFLKPFNEFTKEEKIFFRVKTEKGMKLIRPIMCTSSKTLFGDTVIIDFEEVD